MLLSQHANYKKKEKNLYERMETLLTLTLRKIKSNGNLVILLIKIS
jgi:flagellar basal body L-ring protein FlgH